MAIIRVDFERLARANRNVAEVAKQRALVAIVDIAVECRVFTNRREKILKVLSAVET